MNKIPYLYSVPMDHRNLKTITDWSDQSVVHRTVMSLFPRDLPGDPTERRSQSAILYRLEPSFSRILVQSLAQMSDTSGGVRSTTLDAQLRQVEEAQRVRLRVDMNAVRVDSRTKRRIPVASEDVFAWASTRLDPAFRLGGQVDFETEVRRKSDVPIHTVLIDAHATVTDRKAAIEMLTHGVGRARAYGCGLVSIARVA